MKPPWHPWEWLRGHPCEWTGDTQGPKPCPEKDCDLGCTHGDSEGNPSGRSWPHATTREWPPSPCCGTITEQHTDNCAWPERVSDGKDMPLTGPVAVEWRDAPPPEFLPIGCNDPRRRVAS